MLGHGSAGVRTEGVEVSPPDSSRRHRDTEQEQLVSVVTVKSQPQHMKLASSPQVGLHQERGMFLTVTRPYVTPPLMPAHVRCLQGVFS